MSHILALDIGLRRTGVAYLDEEIGIILPLETINHVSFDELEQQLLALAQERSINHLVIGLPLLLSGEEGEQAGIVRSFTQRLDPHDISYELVDERYTTPRNYPGDGDAVAACEILKTIFP